MSGPARAKVYRNLELRQAWLGLEPLDAILLAAWFWLLSVVNAGGLGWNVLAALVSYAGLRLAKRGRPDGYLAALLRFHTRGPFHSAAAGDSDMRPFPPARAGR